MTSPEPLLQQFLSRAFYDVAAAHSAIMVVIGDRLGLYRAMAGAGPITVDDLATRTGTSPRYVQEWLINQTSGGYVQLCDDGRFFFPDPHASVLAGDEPAAPVIAAFEAMLSLTESLDDVIAAFRSGGGVAGDRYSPAFYSALGRFSSVLLHRRLKSWIVEADLDSTLRAGIDVVDLACGSGSATHLLAAAYPQSSFVGIDVDPASIKIARRTGQLPNLTFVVGDAAAPTQAFDLAMCFNALHDMSDPAAFVGRASTAMRSSGMWLVCEPPLADDLRDVLNPLGRFGSAISTMHCVPVARALGGEGNGSVLGRQRMIDALHEAGFNDVREIDDPFCLVLHARR